jgi:hypothetical protein
MIARCCLSALVALAAVVGFAPARATPSPAEAKALELKPKWKRGDAARFDMVKTVTRESDGKVTRKVTTRTPVEVEVLDTDEDGSIVRWTQGSTVFDDPKFDDDPAIRAFNAILKGLDVDLDLNASGGFTGLRNWKDLRGTGHKVQDAVLAQMAKAGTSKATVELIRKETDKYFATKESIETAFGRLPVLVVLPYGREYEAGKTAEYETELPNVLGGDEPFPAKGEYTLKAVDKDANTATLVFKLAPDPNEMNKVLRKWVDDVAKKAGKPAPKELPELALNDAIEYEFDLAGGWIKTVTHTRTAKQTAYTQTETITLTAKPK